MIRREYCRDHHPVPETEKPEFFLDRLLIQIEQFFASRERGCEHEETTFGDVEIGDEAIDKVKRVVFGDEDIGDAIEVLQYRSL